MHKMQLPTLLLTGHNVLEQLMKELCGHSAIVATIILMKLQDTRSHGLNCGLCHPSLDHTGQASWEPRVSPELMTMTSSTH